MRHIILLVVIVTFFSCGQNDTKQKELFIPRGVSAIIQNTITSQLLLPDSAACKHSHLYIFSESNFLTQSPADLIGNMIRVY